MKRQLREPHLIVAMTMFLLVTGCGRENLAADDEDEQLMREITVELPESGSITDYTGEMEVAVQEEDEERPAGKPKQPGIRIGKKIINKYCKGFLPKPEEAKGKKIIEELLNRTDLSERCKQAVELVQMLREFPKKAKAEKRGDV